MSDFIDKLNIKFDHLFKEVDSLKLNVIAIQKALELMAKSVVLAKEELQKNNEPNRNNDTEVSK